MDPQPAARADLPIRADVQPLHDRGFEEVWGLSRRVAWGKENRPLPPLESWWLRPALTVHSIQRTAEVTPEILGIFKSERKSDQPAGNPLFRPLLGRLVAVAGGGRVAERGRGISQARSERNPFQAANEPIGFRPASDVDRGDRSEAAAEGSLGPHVVWMRRKAGIVDGEHGAVSRQALRQRQGVRAGSGGAKGKRLQTPRGQPTLERVPDQPKRGGDGARSGDAVAGPRKKAQDQVAMPPMSFVNECVT